MRYFRMLVLVYTFFVFTEHNLRSETLDYGALDSFVDIHGLVVQDFYDFGPDGENEGISSFDNRYTYLFVDCLIRENLKGAVEIKLDHGGEEIKIDRSFVDWYIDDLLKIKLGKFYLNILMDVRDYRPTGNKLITSHFPSVLDYDLFRDVGVELSGDFYLKSKKLTYTASVSNGRLLGDSTNEASVDVNENKLFAGDLKLFIANSSSIRGGYVIVESNFIVRNEIESDISPGVSTISNTIIDIGVLEFKGAYVTLDMDIGKFSFLGTYFKALMSGQLGESEIFSTVHTLSYRMFEKSKINYIDIVGRYSRHDLGLQDVFGVPISSNGDQNSEDISLGIIVSPYEHFAIKTEYKWQNEKDSAELDNDGFLMQAVVDF